MLGGYDMNQFGVASQGKLIEKKSGPDLYRRARFPVHCTGFRGHSAKMYKAMLDGLIPRHGLYQCYTPASPSTACPII